MKKLIYFISTAILLSAMSCAEKEKEDHPEYDYQPVHFSCYVNGEKFVPKQQGICWGLQTFYDPDGYLNTEPGYFLTRAQRCLEDDIIAVGFGLTPIIEPGLYSFNDSTLSISNGYYTGLNRSLMFKVYKGYVNITKLEPQTYQPFVRGRIEGTFEMSCANGEGDTVHITDGRFELNLR
ncbi:MAG: hypothetical protein JJU02_06225 [Cryomorphaceae bacterium]|nr:hypothetical protein [Cryomorphaceae bacterium]